MWSVALETSTRPASIALRSPAGEVFERRLDGDRAHASDLLPALAEMLKGGGGGPEDLGAVFVGLGPGSFTGLRVGIATALGLARGCGAKLFGVPSTEVMALACSVGDEVTIVLDARGGALYFARYSRSETGVEIRVEPRLITAPEVEQSLPAAGPVLVDDGVLQNVAFGREASARLRGGVVPSARGVLELARPRFEARGGMPAAEVEPLYLRAFEVRARKR